MQNKLMILGPTAIEKDILELGALPQVYMRTPEFTDRLKAIFENLQYIFQTKNPVLMFASSGSGMMDACVANFFNKDETVLIINGGSFGQRWKDICKNYHINILEIKVPFGDSVNPQDVIELLEKHPNITGVFATHNETSSGALTNIQELGELIYHHSVTHTINKPLFIVDTVSGLLVEKFETDKWHVDVAITASQKALALPPGLGFMSVNTQSMEKAHTIESRPFYFNVIEHIENWKRNQTPFTPAVGIIFQLEKRLEKIRALGLENVQEHYQELTTHLRNGLQQLGLTVFAKNPANAVTGIMLENFDASILVKRLAMEYHIAIAPSGGELEHKFIRIGNFGDIHKKGIDAVILGISNILKNSIKKETV